MLSNAGERARWATVRPLRWPVRANFADGSIIVESIFVLTVGNAYVAARRYVRTYEFLNDAGELSASVELERELRSFTGGAKHGDAVVDKKLRKLRASLTREAPLIESLARRAGVDTTGTRFTTDEAYAAARRLCGILHDYPPGTRLRFRSRVKRTGRPRPSHADASRCV